MSNTLPPLPLSPGIRESYLSSHDLTYHLLSAGDPKNPLIVCLHGFPELAYSYRKILPAIAAEGYHVVAYDQRGYGRTTGWDTREYSSVNLNSFKFTNLVRDAVILVNRLGYKDVACIIGNDFGGLGASLCALMRPDVFKSVVIMTHPFKGSPTIPLPASSPSDKENVHETLSSLPEPRKHYKWYYSTSSAASEMLNPTASLSTFFRGYFHLKSADWEGNNPQTLSSWSASELSKLPYYYIMPLEANMRESVSLSMSKEDPSKVTQLSSRWLPDDELSVFVSEYQRTGFQGGLNWYRVGTSSELTQDLELFAGKKIEVPCIFISGRKDWGAYQDPGVVEGMSEVCTKFKGAHFIDSAGHWVQQEQPEKVVELVTKFLKEVKVESISYWVF